MKKSLINRNQLIDLSNAAFQVGNLDCAKRLLIAWLKEYPNDLWIRYRLAIVLYKSGKTNEAIRLSEIIIKYDPEFTEVWALLAALYPEQSEDKKNAANRVKQLRAYERGDNAANNGLLNLFSAKAAGQKFENIEDVDDFDVLSAIRIARNAKQQEDVNSYFRMMKIYTRRWPKAIQFKLLLGDVMNRLGSVDEGTKIIHSTLEDDLMGQVANRLWKNQNAYANLWLDPNSFLLDVSKIAIPLKVGKKAKLDRALAIDWDENDGTERKGGSANRAVIQDDSALEADEMPAAAPAQIREETRLDEVETDLPEAIEVSPKEIAAPLETKQIINPGCAPAVTGWFKRFFGGRNLPQGGMMDSIQEAVYKLDVNDADERFPVYVVLSTIAGLTAKYGKNNKDFIDQEMHSVADAVENRQGWNAMVFYPDEFQSNGKSLLDPKTIRNALIKLDQNLSQKGSMIGALLIVGGHDVVPFFTLSNPAMDDDLTIHSDAPYGSHEPSRFFDQQWQVGRIPGDNSNDPGLLLSQLRTIQNYHISKFDAEQSSSKRKNPKSQISSRFAKTVKTTKSFGYSAAVWQRPSVAVYRNLTDGADLLTSPATMSSNFPSSRLESIDYGYFNLHGVKGQPNWYGQKDSRDTSAIPMIPIALEIQNVQRVNRTPKVVFAENCYGAEIVNRTEANALSLHMLGKGTRVFIGSTVIAYGAMNLPLTAADLFGYLFWKHLMTGISCGEAFRRAKKNMAAETESGTGALDGEIQKTLISFVFYGDPLYAVSDDADITDRMQRAKTPRSYELIRERMDSKVAIDTDMAKRIYTEVKEMYEMQGVSDEFSSFTIQKQIMNAKSGDDPQKYSQNQNYVIVYTKDAKVGSMLDRLITRVTVSKEGKIRKVSFSR